MHVDQFGVVEEKRMVVGWRRCDEEVNGREAVPSFQESYHGVKGEEEREND